MLSLKNLAASVSACVLLLSLITLPANGHATVAVDQNTSLLLGKLGNQGSPNTGPLLVHSLVTVRLRPDDLQMDLTLADSAAYQLLENDPYSPPADVPSASPPDPHFARDQPLLIQRAADLFSLTNNDAPLKLEAISLELTSTQDIVFHFTYPRATPGVLRLQARYVDKLPPSQKILVEALDGNHSVIAYSALGADDPAMEIPVAAPAPTTAPTPKFSQWLGVAGAALAAGGLFWLIGKMRREPPEE